MTLAVRAAKTGLRFEVKVKVRASRSAVLGVDGEHLSVALAAPPVDGAANEALRRLLAEHFDVPQRDVQIVGGEKSRRKLIELRGISLEDLINRLR
jgi:uncharacterized protein (TIGR00251 family)